MYSQLNWVHLLEYHPIPRLVLDCIDSWSLHPYLLWLSELFCLCCVAALKSLPALSFNAHIFPILRIVCTISFHYSCPWISSMSFFYVFVLSCVCYVFARICLYVLCGHLLGKGWPLGSRLWCLLWVCHFPIGILGPVWYLIVSIPDLCTPTYFNFTYKAISIKGNRLGVYSQLNRVHLLE